MMDERLPLSALLWQALVAFTIEFDNEFEHRMPHRTTMQGGSKSDPWLVSMVFWRMLLRFIPADGIAAKELMRLSGLTREQMRLWLTRLSKWWGYLTVEKPSLIIRPTRGGQKAIAVWTPLAGVIEERWRERFETKRIDELSRTLKRLVEKLDHDLPDYMPILGYPLLSKPDGGAGPAASKRQSSSLPGMLAKLLLAFAIEFEALTEQSLAISANVLRLLGKDCPRVRDLPKLSGVSKEGVAGALGRLEEGGLVEMQAESDTSRTRVFRLTAKGREACKMYQQLAGEIEESWKVRFGEVLIADLRAALEGLQSKLSVGLEPYPDGWRAAVPKADTLPHFPMVLHRGGFPDGS